MRVQGDFLKWPTLRLTLSDAQQRFGVDGVTCEAVFGALVDAQALTRTRHGDYTRFFPRASISGDMRGLRAFAVCCDIPAAPPRHPLPRVGARDARAAPRGAGERGPGECEDFPSRSSTGHDVRGPRPVRARGARRPPSSSCGTRDTRSRASRAMPPGHTELLRHLVHERVLLRYVVRHAFTRRRAFEHGDAGRAHRRDGDSRE